MKYNRTFFDLFETNKSLLKVKFNINSDEEAIEVQIMNELTKQIDRNGLINLENICEDDRLNDFVDFYSNYNGFSLGTPISPKNVIKKALIRQMPVSDLIEFTKQYLPDGKWAWTIDLNKTKSIYRGGSKWLVFAQIVSGPACLTIFLNGENAGNVFLLTPQPHFNILKPIAKTYSGLLERIAKDPAAFFKLTKAYVSILGKDKYNYGHVPIEYVDN